MDLSKIVRLVAVLAAIVFAFTNFAQEAMILAILGLAAGWFIEEDMAMRFLVSAVALGVCFNALDAIPAVGPHLTAILGSMSALFYAGACMVIVKRTVEVLKP